MDRRATSRPRRIGPSVAGSLWVLAALLVGGGLDLGLRGPSAGTRDRLPRPPRGAGADVGRPRARRAPGSRPSGGRRPSVEAPRATTTRRGWSPSRVSRRRASAIRASSGSSWPSRPRGSTSSRPNSWGSRSRARTRRWSTTSSSRGAARFAGEGHRGPKGEADDAGGRRVDRVAMLGVSFGAGVVIRALARGAEGDPDPSTVSAVLLVGPPDDAEALASRGSAARWRRRGRDRLDGGAERRGLVRTSRHRARRRRATAARRRPRARPRAWLDADGRGAVVRDIGADGPRVGGGRPARRRGAWPEAEVAADDLAWVLAGATPFLERVLAGGRALARAGARPGLPGPRRGGRVDPRRGESRALAARLTSAREVEVLESRLLSHVDVGAPGVAETWRHVTFVQRFFDAAGAR